MFYRQASDPSFNKSRHMTALSVARTLNSQPVDQVSQQQMYGESTPGEPCGDSQSQSHQQIMAAWGSSSNSLYDRSGNDEASHCQSKFGTEGCSGLQLTEDDAPLVANEQNVAPTRNNACKGQRARYRKLAERLFQQIREDPVGVDINGMQSKLPPSVAANEWLKNKRINRLVQEKARLLQSSPVASNS
jgi:hypothetical protein